MNAVPQILTTDDLIKLSFEWQSLLRRVAHQYLKRRDLVEEALQDVRVSIFTRPRPEPVVSAKGWLITLTRNCAIDLARHIHVAREELVPSLECDDEMGKELASTTDDPGTLAETADELRVMISAIREISECRRQVFILKKVYGYTQREIAQRLGISENTVEKHMVHALKDLARIYGRKMGLHAR